jgi:dTDP-4-dehydrorhamnose 3,5-epimerase
MQFIPTKIKGVYIIEPNVYTDDRGYFYESYRQDQLAKEIGDVGFVQDNQSFSSYGVLRGLHFQNPPRAQSKLVRCIQGSVLDVAVDLRKESSTFGEHVAVELNEANHKQLFIPHGFAHGFIVLSKTALFSYKCDDYYSKHHEAGVMWNDATIGIDWRLPEKDIIVSEKDSNLPILQHLESPF